MMNFSKGDRVRLIVCRKRRIWFVELAPYYGIYPCGYQLLTLVDPDTQERKERVLHSEVELVGCRLIAEGRFPRLVAVNGETVAP